MASPNSSTPAITDEQLLEQLTAAHAAAQAELAELEPKREQLTQRVASLEHTIAVFKGESPTPVRRGRPKGSRTRKPRASAETPAAS